MGRMSELAIEIMQQREDDRVARFLGLSFDEYEQYLTERDVHTSDDGLVYEEYFVFDKDMPAHVRNKIRNIDNENRVTGHPWEFVDSLNLYEFDAIVEGNAGFETFKNEFADLRLLNDVEQENAKLNAILKRQIYVSAVGVMEAFLSQNFITRVTADESILRKYVESTPAFRQRKFDLASIFGEMAKVKATVKDELLSVMYHNIHIVSLMYYATLGIQFPDFSAIMKIVQVRHDLVHRNGKTKDGANVSTLRGDVFAAIDSIEQFCREISDQLEAL